MLGGELVRVVVRGHRATDRRKACPSFHRRQRAEDCLVLRAQDRVGGDHVQDLQPRTGVLEGRLERHEGLTPQSIDAPVPELPALMRGVDQRGCVPLEGQQPDRDTLTVRERLGRIVAGRAGAIGIPREALVEEQPLSEARGGRVVGEGVGRVGREGGERGELQGAPALLRGQRPRDHRLGGRTLPLTAARREGQQPDPGPPAHRSRWKGNEADSARSSTTRSTPRTQSPVMCRSMPSTR